MAARERAHPHGRALPSFAPREMLVQLRAVFAGWKATGKGGSKTGQGAPTPREGLRRSGWRRRRWRKRRRPTARVSPFPSGFRPSEVKQESRGFAEFGLPGVADPMRAQRVASALNPLWRRGTGFAGGGPGRGWKGCASRRWRRREPTTRTSTAFSGDAEAALAAPRAPMNSRWAARGSQAVEGPEGGIALTRRSRTSGATLRGWNLYVGCTQHQQTLFNFGGSAFTPWSLEFSPPS